MCIPYIIPDPPPKKRTRRSGLIAQSSPPKSPKLQPAFIEISPRLTYVASPKPDRSPVPSRSRISAMKPPRAPGSEFLDGFVEGEQASRQEEGEAGQDGPKPAEPKPKPTPPAQAPAESPEPARPAKEKPAPPQQSQDPPADLAKPKPFQPSPPSPPAPRDSRTIPFAPPPPQTKPQSRPQAQPYHPIRSPYSYTRRPPPPQHKPHHRSRSLSSDSTISRRSFDGLKRNMHVLLERVKVLEAEKEVDRRRGRRGWELGMGSGRREGSLIRERRERERQGKREEERWDWEGGGLGRR